MRYKEAATKVVRAAEQVGEAVPYIIHDFLNGEDVDTVKLRQAINRVWASAR